MAMWWLAKYLPGLPPWWTGGLRRGPSLRPALATKRSPPSRRPVLAGLADLSAHAGAAQRFMPGIEMRRKGEVRQCQGTVLADWVADGVERMSGANVFVMGVDGRVEAATGFAGPQRPPA